MIGPHMTKYTRLQAAYLNSFMTMFFALCFYLRNWNYSFGKILLKLILIVLLPINAVIAISVFVIYLLGYIFNLIPIIRDILSVILLLLYCGLTSYLFMLMNAYDFHNYAEEAKDFDSSNVS